MARICVKARKFDLVHVQYFPLPAFDCVCFWLISRRTPVVCTVHEVVPRGSKFQWITGWLFRSIYRGADLLFTHTEHTDRQLICRYDVSASKLVRTPMGHLEHLLDKKRECSHADSIPVILFIGQIREDKGLDILIRAASYLRSKVNHFRIVVAGKADFDLSGLRQLVDELGLRDFFDFRLGFQEEQEFVDRLVSSTVVVLPYRRAEQSAVAIAACTLGKAIVATRCGGLEELVTEAGNGLLVPVEDPVALAQALADLLVDGQKREAFERCSEEYALKALSWRGIAAKTIIGYQAAAKARRAVREGRSRTLSP